MMSIKHNGVVFFELNENYDDYPACKVLEEVSLGDVRFPFGFFVVEENGKKSVLPGTKDDLLKTLLAAFPNYPAESLRISCLPDVFDNNKCKGGCANFPNVYRCLKMVDEGNSFFGCACVDIS
jgi:hypothetical protein